MICLFQSGAIASATRAGPGSFTLLLAKEPPHAFRRGGQLVREPACRAPDGRRDGAADRVARTFARALRAVRSRAVAPLREDVVDARRNVAEARHPVVDDVRVQQL